MERAGRRRGHERHHRHPEEPGARQLRLELQDWRLREEYLGGRVFIHSCVALCLATATAILVAVFFVVLDLLGRMNDGEF